MDDETPDKKIIALPQISGISKLQGFSGLEGPPEVMASGSPIDDHVELQVASVSKAKLKDEDLAMLLLLLRREEEASKARNEFCVKIEKKYGFGGFTWTFDPQSGTIQRTGKRKPEKK